MARKWHSRRAWILDLDPPQRSAAARKPRAIETPKSSDRRAEIRVRGVWPGLKETPEKGGSLILLLVLVVLLLIYMYMY